MEQGASRIPESILDDEFAGTALHTAPNGGTTLRAQLDPARPTLLLLLRHLGCIFCREMVKDVRIAADSADAGRGEKRYPRVVFVHQGTPEQGARFFGRYWPGAPAISGPCRRLYEALGVERGRFGQLVGPIACACAARAILKGHAVGRPVGDVRMMPGAMLVSSDGDVVQRHVFRHAGDHPKFGRYAELESFLTSKFQSQELAPPPQLA